MKKVLPGSVFFKLLCRTRDRRWRRITTWGWSWRLLVMWSLIHIIDWTWSGTFVVSFQLETIGLTVARFATVKANTLISVLHVFGRLWNVANLHGYDVGISILPWMENAILWTVLILCAILEFLNKLLFVHGWGEVKSNFSSFGGHDCISHVGRLV